MLSPGFFACRAHSMEFRAFQHRVRRHAFYKRQTKGRAPGFQDSPRLLWPAGRVKFGKATPVNYRAERITLLAQATAIRTSSRRRLARRRARCLRESERQFCPSAIVRKHKNL